MFIWAAATGTMQTKSKDHTMVCLISSLHDIDPYPRIMPDFMASSLKKLVCRCSRSEKCIKIVENYHRKGGRAYRA